MKRIIISLNFTILISVCLGKHNPFENENTSVFYTKNAFDKNVYPEWEKMLLSLQDDNDLKTSNDFQNFKDLNYDNNEENYNETDQNILEVTKHNNYDKNDTNTELSKSSSIVSPESINSNAKHDKKQTNIYAFDVFSSYQRSLKESNQIAKRSLYVQQKDDLAIAKVDQNVKSIHPFYQQTNQISEKMDVIFLNQKNEEDNAQKFGIPKVAFANLNVQSEKSPFEENLSLFKKPLVIKDAISKKKYLNPLFAEFSRDINTLLDRSYRITQGKPFLFPEKLKQDELLTKSTIEFADSSNPLKYEHEWHVKKPVRGKQGWYHIEKDDYPAYVAYTISENQEKKPNIVTIVFRGSQGKSVRTDDDQDENVPLVFRKIFEYMGGIDYFGPSWQTNWDAIKKNILFSDFAINGVVHEGYANAFLDMEEGLFESLKEALEEIAIKCENKSALENTQLIIAGHSQGAGRLSVCSAKIIRWFIDYVYGTQFSNDKLNVCWVYQLSPSRAIGDAKTASEIYKIIGINNWIRLFSPFDVVTFLAFGSNFNDYIITSTLAKTFFNLEGGFVSMGHALVMNFERFYKNSFSRNYESAKKSNNEILTKAYSYLLENVDNISKEADKIYQLQLEIKELSYGLGKHGFWSWDSDSIYNPSSWINLSSWLRATQYRILKTKQTYHFLKYISYFQYVFPYTEVPCLFLNVHHFGCEQSYQLTKEPVHACGQFFDSKIPDSSLEDLEDDLNSGIKQHNHELLDSIDI